MHRVNFPSVRKRGRNPVLCDQLDEPRDIMSREMQLMEKETLWSFSPRIGNTRGCSRNAKYEFFLRVKTL